MSTTSSNILKDLSWQLQAPQSPSWREKIKGTLSSSFRAVERSFSRVTSLLKRGPTLDPTISLGQGTLSEPRNRFMEAVKRIEFQHSFRPVISSESPYGFFRNRPVIGESSKVHGGIFVGATPHEALVVDEKYGILDKIYSLLEVRCQDLDRALATFEYDVFSKTINLTRETLRFSEEGVRHIELKYKIQADDKVTLDLYIKRKVGVSRHQVLLAAFLLERLRERGVIRGVPTIESQISESIPQERLLFTSGDGEIFRFDPTKGLGKTAIH